MKTSVIIALVCAASGAGGSDRPAQADGPSVAAPAPLPGTEPVEPARPIPPGYACGVHVLRAPAELAPAIEARLAALSACGRRLDVWIVRAQDGLYVIARDELGRVRERVVPDAEVASALIASWVEIDAATPLTGAANIQPSPASSGRFVAPPASELAAPLAPPAPELDRVPAVRAAASADDPTVGLTVFAGFTSGGMTTGGALIDHDLWRHEGLSVAAMAVLTRDVASSYYIVRWDDDFFKETGRWGGAMMVELHRRFGTGRLRFTPSVAFGLGATRHEILTAGEAPVGELAMPVMVGETTLGPKIVAQAALGVRIAASLDLELSAGWMFTGYQASDRGVDPSDHALVGGIGLRHDR